MKIRLLTYNIHKGFSIGNRRFILQKIKQSIREVDADVVCLQEVLGEHEEHSKKVENWPTQSQFEFLADQTWSHFAYGKNAVYTEGHHGNAVLSKFPISFWSNRDVSFTKIERRGLLHAVLSLENHDHPLHIFCLHLGLFEKDRKAQIEKLTTQIRETVPENAPLLIAGDFNDWRQTLSNLLTKNLHLKEAFLETRGRHARTYPAAFPLLSLDRIYFKNMKCLSVQTLNHGIWSELSDHLPLLGEFEL